MNCKKCGAKIPQGYVYCKVCGNEVQLVPDYNLLDDDILSDIVQQEGKTDLPEPILRKKRSARINLFIWGSISAVLCLAVLTLFFVYRDILQKQRNSYDYQYQKAEECFARKDYDNAALHYEKSLALNPNDPKAKKKLVDIYMDLGETETAISLLEGWVKADEADKDSIQALIALYDANEEYDKILALCEKAGKGENLELFADYLVEQPKFSHMAGTYFEPITVALSSEEGYDIFYTTDGRDPALYGKPYTKEISLEEEKTTEIAAVAKNAKGICSKEIKADYTISHQPPETPRVTPAGGTYDEPQQITVEVPEHCVAYYTWDGTDPNEGSFRYTSPLEMPQGNQVLSVVLINSFGLKSGIYRVNYVYMP